MEYQFTAVFEEVSPEEGGGYMVYIEEMPGAISQGETLEEARENIKDALKLMIEANREQSGDNHEIVGRVFRETVGLPAAM